MANQESQSQGEARSSVASAAEQVRQRSRETAQDARDAAGRAGERLRESARSAGVQAKERAAQAGHELRSRGEAYMQEQKGRAADEVSHFSAAVRSAAERLHENEDDNVAAYAESLADQIDRASEYLRQREVAELMHDAQEFARRRPEIVLGGMFVAGLVVARLLKASSTPPRSATSSGAGEGYDEYALDREAALDAGAETVGSHLPPGPTGAPRAFEAGGFSTVTSSNPTGATPDTPPGSAPSSPYYPSGPEEDKPSGWGSVSP